MHVHDFSGTTPPCCPVLNKHTYFTILLIVDSVFCKLVPVLPGGQTGTLLQCFPQNKFPVLFSDKSWLRLLVPCKHSAPHSPFHLAIDIQLWDAQRGWLQLAHFCHCGGAGGSLLAKGCIPLGACGRYWTHRLQSCTSRTNLCCSGWVCVEVNQQPWLALL